MPSQRHFRGLRPSAQTPQSVPAGPGAPPKVASEQDIQLLREDIRAQRKQITASNMTLTPDEATKFWPIYDQYIQETIKINDGPFLNFSGVIEEIDPERGKLKVTVNIFGRNTPVELEYWQVEKA